MFGRAARAAKRRRIAAGLGRVTDLIRAAADGDPHLVEALGSRTQVKYGQGHPRGATGRLPARYAATGSRKTSSIVIGRPASQQRCSRVDWRNRRSPVTSSPSQAGLAKD